jgi:hypothetical protein
MTIDVNQIPTRLAARSLKIVLLIDSSLNRLFSSFCTYK